MACEICRRDEILTKHHLVPRKLHNNTRLQRLFGGKRNLQTHVIKVCRPCHDAIHKAKTEKELAFDYNTLDKILSIPEIINHANWISNKRVGFTPK